MRKGQDHLFVSEVLLGSEGKPMDSAKGVLDVGVTQTGKQLNNIQQWCASPASGRMFWALWERTTCTLVCQYFGSNMTYQLQAHAKAWHVVLLLQLKDSLHLELTAIDSAMTQETT